MKTLLILCTVFALATSITLAKGNNKYLVSVPQTKEECMNAIEDFKGKSNLLKITDWGCMSGDHTAYFSVMAKSEEDVRNMLPEKERDKAKIVN